jgi:hypothetical protein
MAAFDLGTTYSAGASLPQIRIHRHKCGRLITAVRFNPKRLKDMPEVLVENLTDDDPFVIPSQKSGVAISLYVPHNSIASNFPHSYFKSKASNAATADLGCWTSTLAYKVPAGMEVVYDLALELNVAKPGQPRNNVDFGLHFSMYPTKRMRLSEFTEMYDKVLSAMCTFKAGAEPLELLYAAFPPERKMVVISSALAQGADASTNPNTSLLCWAYHHHISAVELSYKQFLQQGVTPFLVLVAWAMEQASSPSDFMYQNEGNAIKKDLAALLDYDPKFFDDMNTSDGGLY